MLGHLWLAVPRHYTLGHPLSRLHRASDHEQITLSIACRSIREGVSGRYPVIRLFVCLVLQHTLNIDLMKCCAYSFQAGTFRTKLRVYEWGYVFGRSP